MNLSFALHKNLYSFIWFHSLIVHLSIYSNGILFITQDNEFSYFPFCLLSGSVYIEVFDPRRLDRYVDLLSFFYKHTWSLTSIVCWRCCHYMVFISGFFIKKKSGVHILWIYIWVFKSISLINVSVFMTISCVEFLREITLNL